MKPINRKKLILSLIKDNMIYTKLVLGLNATGLYADPYFRYLSQTMFDLLGYEDDEYGEQVYNFYMMHLRKRVKQTSANHTNPLMKR